MKLRSICAALVLLTVFGLARAVELAPKQLAVMALRVLAYDRNLKARSGDKAAIVIVLFNENDPVSEALSQDLNGAFEELSSSVTVAGRPLRVKNVAFSNAAALDANLSSLRPAALVVCSGLSDALPGIVAAARKRQALTMTSVPNYLKAGLSIGLLRNDERAQVVVNLPAARAEGADLDAALLRVADVIR